jgi:hypothetical protein
VSTPPEGGLVVGAMTQWTTSAESESGEPIVMLNLIRYGDAALDILVE